VSVSSNTRFLAQAIPWMALMALWTVLALASMLCLSIPLRLLGAALRWLSTGIEAVIAALLALLMAARPVPPQGTNGDPTATAPVTP
jgi:hypothetical protein